MPCWLSPFAHTPLIDAFFISLLPMAASFAFEYFFDAAFLSFFACFHFDCFHRYRYCCISCSLLDAIISLLLMLRHASLLPLAISCQSLFSEASRFR